MEGDLPVFCGDHDVGTARIEGCQGKLLPVAAAVAIGRHRPDEGSGRQGQERGAVLSKKR